MQKIRIAHIIKLIISLTLSTTFFILYLKREKKRYENNKIKLKDKQKYELTILALSIMTTKERSVFLQNLFTKTQTSNQNSQIKTKFGFQYCEQSKDSIQSSIQKIIDRTQRYNYEKFYAIIPNNDDSINILKKYSIIKSKNINILSMEDLYNMMKISNFFPETKHLEKEKLKLKEKTKIFFQNLLYKRNAKAFFFAGAMIFVTSLYLPFYKTYYLTMSFILLSIASICLIFGKKTTDSK